MLIESIEEFKKLTDGNLVLGKLPKLHNTVIRFSGKNNILYCEEDVFLDSTIINFQGDNSVIYLGSNYFHYMLDVTIYNDSIFHMGKNNYINNKLTVILSEQKHCFIGDNGLFSHGVHMRNADPHLIYDCNTGRRINQSKSIFWGDHIWVGQDVIILKGSHIDSGSIIGAKSVVAGKHITHNTIWCGNPCREISTDIFWDKDCVHNWTEERTMISQEYERYIKEYKEDCSVEYWIYNYTEEENIDYICLEKEFHKRKNSKEKCEYLINLNSDKKKNRFVQK